MAIHDLEPPTLVQPTTPRSHVARLLVVTGPDRGLSVALGARAPERVVVGTSPSCEVRLTDATVSRKHAALERVGARLRLTDLQSTNGTFVNGLVVMDAFVVGGELVRCGGTMMRLDVSETAIGPTTAGFGLLKGASPAMTRLYPAFERLARSRVPLVLEGETGTGKELLAESLHLAGGTGRFVVFDCSAIAPDLVERELFGAEEPGLFEDADGGTIFFDQIDDLPPAVQSKIVRVLDRGEIRRVRGRRWIKVDVRVLAAPRRDLDEAARVGRLREDLLERLAVARIALPPLRERAGDVPLLVRHFSEEMTGSPEAVPPEIVARFAEHAWPGNVRELRSAVARYIATGEFHPEARRPSVPAPPETALMPFARARRLALSRFERSYVEGVLAAHGGNVTQAARASGLALRYFRVLKARAAKVDSTA